MPLEFSAPTKSKKIYSLKNQAHFWNVKATEGINFQISFDINKFNQHLKLNGMDKNANILEIGCGYGRNLNLLQQRGYLNLIGVDFAEKMIERGKIENPSLNLQYGDGRNLAFPDHSFDVVILFNVLTCMINDNDQLALLKEIKRILKSDGLIYVSDLLLSDKPSFQERYNQFIPSYNKYGVYEFQGGGVCRDHHPDWIRILFSEFTIQWELENNNSQNLCGKDAKPFQIIAKYNSPSLQHRLAKL